MVLNLLFNGVDWFLLLLEIVKTPPLGDDVWRLFFGLFKLVIGNDLLILFILNGDEIELVESLVESMLVDLTVIDIGTPVLLLLLLLLFVFEVDDNVEDDAHETVDVDEEADEVDDVDEDGDEDEDDDVISWFVFNEGCCCCWSWEGWGVVIGLSITGMDIDLLGVVSAIFSLIIIGVFVFTVWLFSLDKLFLFCWLFRWPNKCGNVIMVLGFVFGNKLLEVAVEIIVFEGVSDTMCILAMSGWFKLLLFNLLTWLFSLIFKSKLLINLLLNNDCSSSSFSSSCSCSISSFNRVLNGCLRIKLIGVSIYNEELIKFTQK